jgi:hypothetical protein
VHNFPKCIYRDIDGLGFGENYTKHHNVWIFDFEPDDLKRIILNDDSIYYLRADTDMVPMVNDLKNTAKFNKNCLFHSGPNQNIHIFSI